MEDTKARLSRQVVFVFQYAINFLSTNNFIFDCISICSPQNTMLQCFHTNIHSLSILSIFLILFTSHLTSCSIQPKLLRSLVKQRTSRQNEQTAETKQDGNDRDDQKSIPLKVEEKGTNPASEKLGDNNLESHPTKRFKVSTGKSSSLVDYDSDCSSGSDVNNETQWTIWFLLNLGCMW